MTGGDRIAKRYYWLKLKKDFFKRQEIVVLESMPGGREIILFYLKLLLESIESEGLLRVNERVAHTPETLAMITHADGETVRNALEQLERFGLLKTLEDQTILLPGMEEMIGSESEKAELMRKARENRKMVENGNIVTKCYPEKEKEKEIEKEKESDQEVEDEMSSGEVFFRQAPPFMDAPPDFRVQLTLAQHRLLRERMGVDRVAHYLEKMDEFTDRKRQRIRDPVATILKWYEEDTFNPL